MIFRMGEALRTRAVMTLLLTAFAACVSAGDKPQSKLPAKDLVITTKAGAAVTVHAELARTQDEKSKGLMFRAALADGEGMLFVWENDTILSFWMKNTILPLSIAYISKDGVIMEIHDMRPGQLTGIQSRRSLRYALEVPQGWFARAGVDIGDTIQL